MMSGGPFAVNIIIFVRDTQNTSKTTTLTITSTTVHMPAPLLAPPYQRYVYSFSVPQLKRSASFTRLEQVITIPGCRVSNTLYFTEKRTVIRTQRKHALIMLQVNLQGSMIYQLPSAERISLSGGTYHLLRMDAGQHQLLLLPGVNEYIRFDIAPALLQELLPGEILVKDLLDNNINGEMGVTRRKIYTLISQMRNSNITDDLQRLQLYTHITELIITAVTSLPTPTKHNSMNNPHHELVTRIQTYISENLHKSISLSMLAGIYYISESKLKQDFRKYLNSSVQSYLQEQRMAKALKMLQHSDDEIAEIASEVGYTNVSSFTREFRKHYACSPKEIRIR